MTLEQAEALAVVATAQLIAGLPWVDATVAAVEGDGEWQVVVSWERGADTPTMADVLEGPPTGVVLVSRTHVG